MSTKNFEVLRDGLKVLPDYGLKSAKAAKMAEELINEYDKAESENDKIHSE